MEFLSLSGFLRGEDLFFWKRAGDGAVCSGVAQNPRWALLGGQGPPPLTSVTLWALSLVLGSQWAAAASPAN